MHKKEASRGLRSILQMDLEHIKSLKSGGYDRPREQLGMGKSKPIG